MTKTNLVLLLSSFFSLFAQNIPVVEVNSSRSSFTVFEGKKSQYSEVIQFHFQKHGLRECSASIVGENVLITNSHCIQGIKAPEFWLSDAVGNRVRIHSEIKCFSHPDYLKLDSEAFWNENSRKRSLLEEKTILLFAQWKKNGLLADHKEYHETKLKLSEVIKQSDFQAEKIGSVDLAVCVFDKGKKLKELKTACIEKERTTLSEQSIFLVGYGTIIKRDQEGKALKEISSGWDTNYNELNQIVNDIQRKALLKARYGRDTAKYRHKESGRIFATWSSKEGFGASGRGDSGGFVGYQTGEDNNFQLHLISVNHAADTHHEEFDEKSGDFIKVFNEGTEEGSISVDITSETSKRFLTEMEKTAGARFSYCVP